MFDFIKRHKLSISFFLLLFVSINIYSKNLKTKSDLNKLQALILEITLPLQRGVGNVISSFNNIIDNYIFLVGVKKENIALKQSIEIQNAKIERLKEIEITNERYKELFDFKKNLKNETIAADVVSKGASSWLNTIVINKGKKHGIIPGLAVVAIKGVVGQIIYTTDNYAQVLLITDKNSAVDVINQTSRTKGIVKGIKENLCKVDYVLSKEDVNVGEIVITSGFDGVFPKGMFVGKVVNVVKDSHNLFQNILLEPFVDFDKLEEVLVVAKKEELLEEVQNLDGNQ